MIPRKPLISRKDIAQMIGLSVTTVARHEVRWGLKRVDMGTQTVLFKTSQAIRVLSIRGFID